MSGIPTRRTDGNSKPYSISSEDEKRGNTKFDSSIIGFMRAQQKSFLRADSLFDPLRTETTQFKGLSDPDLYTTEARDIVAKANSKFQEALTGDLQFGQGWGVTNAISLRRLAKDRSLAKTQARKLQIPGQP